MKVFKKIFKNKKWKAVATLVGTTIGAGMFGLPYVVVKVGFPLGFLYLLFLGGVVLFLNLAYGEVILRTPGDHQFSGYLNFYLKPKEHILRFAELVSFFISAYGALLAYLVKVGDFSVLLLGRKGPDFYSLLFFGLATIALYFGLRWVSFFDFVAVFLIFLVLGGLFLFNFSHINPEILRKVDFSFFFLPYGVILFALNGSSVIPEMEEVLRKEHGKLKNAVVIGTLIPLVVYFIFVSLVGGICGESVSPDSVSCLPGILPSWAVGLTAFLGILTMSSSFVSFAYVLRERWYRDYKFPKFWSFVLVLFPPLLLFFLGVRDFLGIIEFSGALSIGLIGILILLMHKRAKSRGKREPAYNLKIPLKVRWLLIFIFISGAVLSLIFN